MRTAFNCWNFFSSRGSVVVRSVANVESGTSLSWDALSPVALPREPVT